MAALHAPGPQRPLSLALEGLLADRLSPQAGKSTVISLRGRGNSRCEAIAPVRIPKKTPLSLEARGVGERVNCTPTTTRKQGVVNPR